MVVGLGLVYVYCPLHKCHLRCTRSPKGNKKVHFRMENNQVYSTDGFNACFENNSQSLNQFIVCFGVK
uniref:Secreted protein n=1 Tax=Heterorhabditis bacteriophora TaxID=37862 RepID=A0A1I7WLU2_HETBA